MPCVVCAEFGARGGSHSFDGDCLAASDEPELMEYEAAVLAVLRERGPLNPGGLAAHVEYYFKGKKVHNQLVADLASHVVCADGYLAWDRYYRLLCNLQARQLVVYDPGNRVALVG